MRTNHKFYRAGVVDNSQSAHHIIVTYNFRQHDDNTLFEFYRVVFTGAFERAIDSIPPGRELTFEEELLATNFASHIAQLQGEDRLSEIERKLREVYGGSADLQIEEIEAR